MLPNRRGARRRGDNVIAETVYSIHRGLVGTKTVTIVTFYAGSTGTFLSEVRGVYRGTTAKQLKI